MIDLKNAHILITNDDGIDAPGIAVLERVARSLCDNVWVVAPDTEQSAVSHALTVRRPLRIKKKGERRFSVDGTPTDSVFMAVREIMTERLPDLVLSGINNGGNLADDVLYSGTVAAAMEGATLGIPAIALSQRYRPGHKTPWETAEVWAEKTIVQLSALEWIAGTLLSVNFPDVLPDQVKGVEITRLGRRQDSINYEKRVDPSGRAYYWIGSDRGCETGSAGDDLGAIDRGFVSVTPLHVDCTDHALLKRLELSIK